MANQELTTREAAARLNVADVTVRLWCRQGRFPHARAVDTPRGAIWYIPEKDLNGFQPPQPGRPPKAKATDGARSAGKKYGTIESQTATTRKLNKAFRQAVEEEMAGKKGKK